MDDGGWPRTVWGSRLDVFDDLLRAFPRCQDVRHAGPDDRRPSGVGRRHLAERRRGAQHGSRSGTRARRALRPRRRVHGDRALASAVVGRRRFDCRQGLWSVRGCVQGRATGLRRSVFAVARAIHCAPNSARSAGGIQAGQSDAVGASPVAGGRSLHVCADTRYSSGRLHRGARGNRRGGTRSGRREGLQPGHARRGRVARRSRGQDGRSLATPARDRPAVAAF